MAAPKRTEKESRYRGLIAEQRRSGLSVADFARANGLNEGTYSWWRAEIRRRDALRDEACAERRNTAESISFAPVTVVAERSAPALSPTGPERFEVVLPSGVEVRAPVSADEASLTRLLRAAAAAC